MSKKYWRINYMDRDGKHMVRLVAYDQHALDQWVKYLDHIGMRVTGNTISSGKVNGKDAPKSWFTDRGGPAF